MRACDKNPLGSALVRKFFIALYGYAITLSTQNGRAQIMSASSIFGRINLKNSRATVRTMNRALFVNSYKVLIPENFATVF